MEPYLTVGIGLSAAAAGAAAVLWTVIGGAGPDAGRHRAKLRAKSPTYAWFEPSVEALAAFFRQHSPQAMTRLQHALDLVEPGWPAPQYMGVKQVEGVLIGAVAGAGGAVVFGVQPGVMLALLAVAGYPWLAAQSCQSKAAAYVVRVRSRLPFALDLMALLLEAGVGTLPACLNRVAVEHPDQPLGDEVRRTLAGVGRGAHPSEMFAAMDRRLADPDVREVVHSISAAEDNGIALKDALRGLSDRMRQRKVQWMEKSAEQAKVKITGPAMVTMVACLIVVVAPLLLQAVGLARP